MTVKAVMARSFGDRERGLAPVVLPSMLKTPSRAEEERVMDALGRALAQGIDNRCFFVARIPNKQLT
jgi:hypothetical protein